ncbi:lasso peptide biosynthesis B2 protein [Micromonospora endophytica]|nr:lasso peptide biosynthesis B2 protein [Micromonospora endophytica]BCJ62920.1 hypothetical protein Jiend_63420 [Micromonospora endophytica]
MAERGAVLAAVWRTGRQGGLPALRTAWWTVRSVRSVRRQLRVGNLEQVCLSGPPSDADGQHRVLLSALGRCRANCLERALVRQRWYGAQRIPRTIVIGVTAPGAGFAAHAWLDGDDDRESATMVELLRRPVPSSWLRSGG